MRRGKEKYASSYDEAMKMHAAGASAKDIAAKLGVSYSAAYHWTRGLRKPEQGNVSEFMAALKKGPQPVAEMKEKFPKHNELFLIAANRGLGVKRYMLKKRYGDYSTWYYLEGQEKALQTHVDALMDKIREIKEKLSEV